MGWLIAMVIVILLLGLMAGDLEKIEENTKGQPVTGEILSSADHIIDYDIVKTSFNHHSSFSLVSEVKEKMKYGWVPFGAPFTDPNGIFLQAVVKFEEGGEDELCTDQM